MRTLLLGCVLVASSGVAGAQSLGDLARQEAARRRALNQPAILLTNADLTVRPAPVAPDLPPFPDIRPFTPAPSVIVAHDPAPAPSAPAEPFLFTPRPHVGHLGMWAPRPALPRPAVPQPAASPFRNPIVESLFMNR